MPSSDRVLLEDSSVLAEPPLPWRKCCGLTAAGAGAGGSAGALLLSLAPLAAW
jgi:hypothetical protein